MKAWWLGFPKFRCPHCGKTIEGVKFVGHFKLPKVKKHGGRENPAGCVECGAPVFRDWIHCRPCAERITVHKESKREEVRDP